MINAFQNFFRQESATGILLLGAAAAAVLAANSSLAPLYSQLLGLPLGVSAGEAQVVKPLLLWINDGLMAIFFLHVALEVKREILEGELSSPAKAALPGIAAVGGMAVPALVYVWIAWGDPAALNGWAIPAATDIAFALGVLALLGSRVPVSLKVFLLTLAVMDDMGAVVIIALFYTSDLAVASLVLGGLAVAVLVVMNRLGVRSIAPYVLVGIAGWFAVLQSGVHATLAGVAMGFAMPHRGPAPEAETPLERLEHGLKPWVAFAILPVFAFANAGVSLGGVSPERLLGPVPLGIALGLFLGKQIGVFGFAWLAVRTGLAKLPSGVSWGHIYGVSLLTGIGFTMSLFIASLAFEHDSAAALVDDYRIGILAGSILSALAGYGVLRYLTRDARVPAASRAAQAEAV